METERAQVARLVKPFWWLAAVMVLGAVLGTGITASEAKKSAGDASGGVPAALIRWPQSNSKYAILVDKSTQEVMVYCTDDLVRPVKVYPCSTGENQGPKIRQNDKKTPEGIYFFTDSYDERDLAPIYGVGAFPMDYPNPLDRKEGKDGYGIWFHGTNKPLKPNDTNGCIALENGDILDLGKYIDLNDTPAVISSRVEMVSPEELERERERLERAIEDWRKSWEEKRIRHYMTYYGDDFNAKGMGRSQWRDYKTRLAKKYDWIRVGIDNLRLLQHNGTVLAKFDQHYRTGVFDSKGEKRLYLRKNSEDWKIVGEYFVAADERTVPKRPAQPEPSVMIRALVGRWERAWEGMDLATYMDCYHPAFQSRGMDWAEWKEHRRRLNKKYRSVRVEIEDMKIVLLSATRAEVSFKQDYRANGYRDYGLKKLLLSKRDGEWKIIREDWEALKRSRR